MSFVFGNGWIGPTESLFASINTSSEKEWANPALASLSFTRTGGCHLKTAPAARPSSERTGVCFNRYVNGVPSRLSTSKASKTSPTSAVCGALITVAESPHANAVVAEAPPGMCSTAAKSVAFTPAVSISVSFHVADMFAILFSSTMTRWYDTKVSLSVPMSAVAFACTSDASSAPEAAPTVNSVPAPIASFTSVSMALPTLQAPCGGWFTSVTVTTKSTGVDRAPCASMATY
mmetsp:Transcript_917/g.3505  ORF Transcript_917/g.3505 Transcript_917/m.3505 type:complete len:233 (-) Transcript_917:14227-14925(-)